MTAMTFHYRWQWSLRSEVERLWPYVSDTERFNAATGAPPITYTEEPLAEGGSRRIAHTRMYGVPIVWEEAPFQWIRHQEVSETHQYRTGPLAWFKMQLRLSPRADGGTQLTYEVWAQPANVLGYPGIPIQIGIISRMRFERAFQQIDEFIQARKPQPFQTRHTPVSAAGQVRLDEAARQLGNAGHESKFIKRLIDHIRSAPDDQLSRMRAFALADQWGMDRYKALELFLGATRAGLLDLSWDMLCPECRGAKQQAHSLHDVSHAAHCPSCNIDYEVDFARSVEATFQVNPSIRQVTREEFCMGSPQNTPHTQVQQTLMPGESRVIHVALKPGRYRWVAPQLATKSDEPHTINSVEQAMHGQALLKVRARAYVNACTVTFGHNVQVQPEDIMAGESAFTLKNETDKPLLVSLSQIEWSDQSTTAAEVTSLQAFRDLFSSEALRPGESISVAGLTILFTDLKGSTAMYRSIGDALAFRRVMDHFTILRDGVARNHGALVKTIGDAIMAVFTDPANAVAAGLDILSAIQTYNSENPDAPLILKMGIHQGACIAVTLNERLDYFGSVVNLAARLEGQSRGGDMVLSEAVAADPGVQTLLQVGNAASESFTATLKGFEDTVSLHRVTLERESVKA